MEGEENLIQRGELEIRCLKEKSSIRRPITKKSPEREREKERGREREREREGGGEGERERWLAQPGSDKS
jgi:hypothetical protein